MTTVVGDSKDLDAACKELIDAANAAGGPDNITAAIISIDVA
jgi:serine/threonine protein phosphatase PrpC